MNSTENGSQLEAQPWYKPHMTAILQTSSIFASSSASGADWREVGRKILESLETVRTENDGMCVGFIYVTNALKDDLPALLTLLKNVTRIQDWHGASAHGVCGSGKSYAEVPAASVLIGRLLPDSFHGFTHAPTDALPDETRAWLSSHAASIVVTHGQLTPHSAAQLSSIRDNHMLYCIGGFSDLHVAKGALTQAPLSGLIFGANTRVMTGISYGCVLTGAPGRITKCSGSVIETINDKPAYQVLYESLREIELEGENRKGNVHAAFPVPGADTSSYLTRNITAADEDTGTITVAHNFARGDTIRFAYRDAMTATMDLTQALTGLYARGSAEMGAANFKPKAILYFGCGARMDAANDEAALIRHVFGDVPMAGFYATGEICNGHVYGYAGIVTLFL